MSAVIELDKQIEDTARIIADLHAEHFERATPYNRWIARLTESLIAPAVAFGIIGVCTLWIAGNAVAAAMMRERAFDAPPFSFLQVAVGLAAFLMTVIILTSQRHDYWLAERRAQMTLQIALVSEQKIAKLIELVEQLRRDDPQIADRPDPEASAMARSVDSQALTQAVQELRDQ